MNVAYALVRAGVTPTFLSAIGKDTDGDALITHMATHGIACQHITRVDDRTDMYMAIEHEGFEGFCNIKAFRNVDTETEKKLNKKCHKQRAGTGMSRR